ncbi:SCO-spondin [Rhinolophus ferrumequinum]|uniref:SCO-spondin n=1 Tax=Rhinolophus ferrumequinum TaxID=59479 RepID=UPI00140F72BC|nr:SCO-spondin [Rhinolophus ferrumequinum]
MCATSCWMVPSGNAVPSAGALADSGREAQQEAVCTTLANDARDCAKRHVRLRWRQPGFCELCPGGQVYADYALACPPGCSTVGEGEEESCGEGCVRGCECPPGLFWDCALCVPATRCPCYHRRQCYDPMTYVCQDGRWPCAQAPCPAECAVGGDWHCLTFDGRSFSFRGSAGCGSSLMQDFAQGQLLISLECGACDSGSCLHTISVSLWDTHQVQGLCGTFTWNQQDDFLRSIAAFSNCLCHPAWPNLPQQPAGDAFPLRTCTMGSAPGWWTGSRSTCAAWPPCVAVPLAGTACAPCCAAHHSALEGASVPWRNQTHCYGLPAPRSPNRTGVPCPEFCCPDGLCICFQLVRVGSGECRRQSHCATLTRWERNPDPFPPQWMVNGPLVSLIPML